MHCYNNQMPIYEYKCEDCAKQLEIIQKISDAPPEKCSDCGGKLFKLISNSSFVLKGSGWYADGYSSSKQEEKKAAASADSKPAGSQPAGSQPAGSKATESKQAGSKVTESKTAGSKPAGSKKEKKSEQKTSSAA
jgi:putative FmdB family regulatory protein